MSSRRIGSLTNTQVSFMHVCYIFENNNPTTAAQLPSLMQVR